MFIKFFLSLTKLFEKWILCKSFYPPSLVEGVFMSFTQFIYNYILYI
nr:MAG TPA: hypothetical protein [Caudoviricetes sp.]